jgi:DNA-binding MarR family transcriptional regulator
MNGVELGDLNRLIHAPARLLLMANLYVVDEADFVYLSRQTGLTAGNISSHMTKLEDAGYVEITKEFVGKKPRTIYKLTGPGRKAFDDHKERLVGLLQT